MSKRRIVMRKTRQVLDYRLSKGISAEQTALALGLSKGSVINIVQRFTVSGLSWPLPADLTDTELGRQLFPSNDASKPPGVILPDVEYVLNELARPHVTLQRLWEEYHEQNPSGLRRSAYYRYILRNRPKEVYLKMVHKGGDKIYADYSGDGINYIERSTGEIIPCDFFVCCWGTSSHTYAEATESQKTEDFSMSHVRAFEFFGAVSNAVVIDNLKSGVQKSDRYEPMANPVFAKMAEHYNVAVLPARVKKPRDKAVVESGVLHAQRFILARLRNRQFFSLSEVNAAIREELLVFNNLPMKDYGGRSRLERFLELDKPYAKALPAESFKITRMKKDVRISGNYHARFYDHNYSVPHTMAGKCVDIYQVGQIIEIYHDGVHLCRHKAGRSNYGYTTEASHMPPNHSFVRGWSQEWFLAKAGEIGPSTKESVERIMGGRKHVEQGYNSAKGVLRLGKVYGFARVEKACERVLHFKAVSYRTLRAVLEQNLDKQIVFPVKTSEEPLLHENIRGPEYYINP